MTNNGMRVQIARGDAASLADLPNVIAIRGLQVQTIENAVAVPYIGAPQVWQDLGFRGENIKVGIIDTAWSTARELRRPWPDEAYTAAKATTTCPAIRRRSGPRAGVQGRHRSGRRRLRRGQPAIRR